MDFDQFLANITPSAYEKMKQAVATGRWADGRRLTADEKEIVLHTVIAYDHQYQIDDDRIGHVNGQCQSKTRSSTSTDALKWK